MDKRIVRNILIENTTGRFNWKGPKSKYPERPEKTDDIFIRTYGDFPDGDWWREFYNRRSKKKIYEENFTGRWEKWDYDEDGNLIFNAFHTGFWVKQEFENGKIVSVECSECGCVQNIERTRCPRCMMKLSQN